MKLVRGLPLPLLAPHSRITGKGRAELTRIVARHYGAGKSVREISATLGRSYGFAHRLVVESGAPMRKRGGNTRGPQRAAKS